MANAHVVFGSLRSLSTFCVNNIGPVSILMRPSFAIYAYVKCFDDPPGVSLTYKITTYRDFPNTDNKLNTATTTSTVPPQVLLAIRHLRRFQLRPQRLQSSRVNELRRLYYLPSTLIHLAPKQNLILYHFRILPRLHVKDRPHDRASLLHVHVHVCDIDAPRLECRRHALETSDEVVWRLVVLKVRYSGDEVHVAEAEDSIGRKETEDVLVVWIVAAGCFGSGRGHPV